MGVIHDGKGPSKIPPPMLGGYSRCQCTNCGERFNSVSAFDRHRVDEPTSPNGRGCLDEMGMLERGMSVNETGYWITVAFLDVDFRGKYDKGLVDLPEMDDPPLL